ncbi:MAG TPA: YqzL family protein [Firmicutes bacterium]|nr:YqzL family protein [Bacillota bacterium]
MVPFSVHIIKISAHNFCTGIFLVNRRGGFAVEEKTAWKIFERTGSVNAYLAYREAEHPVEMGTVQKERQDAASHRWDCHQPTEYR